VPLLCSLSARPRNREEAPVLLLCRPATPRNSRKNRFLLVHRPSGWVKGLSLGLRLLQASLSPCPSPGPRGRNARAPGHRPRCCTQVQGRLRPLFIPGPAFTPGGEALLPAAPFMGLSVRRLQPTSQSRARASEQGKPRERGSDSADYSRCHGTRRERRAFRACKTISWANMKSQGRDSVLGFSPVGQCGWCKHPTNRPVSSVR